MNAKSSPESRIDSADELIDKNSSVRHRVCSPGSASSTHLHSVVEDVQRLRGDVMHQAGKLFHRPLSDLILGKIIDIREVEGGVSGDFSHELFLQEQGSARAVHCDAQLK